MISRRTTIVVAIGGLIGALTPALAQTKKPPPLHESTLITTERLTLPKPRNPGLRCLTGSTQTKTARSTWRNCTAA